MIPICNSCGLCENHCKCAVFVSTKKGDCKLSRTPGIDAGKIWMSEDFDAPLELVESE